MSIKKVCVTVGALVVFSGYSGAVLADCDTDRVDAIDDALILARAVGCTEYPAGIDGIDSNWDNDNPIWQFRPKKGGNGCEVHYKLIKLIDEKEQEKTGKGKGQAKNENRGVAAALADNNDQYAYDQLQEFMDTIMYSAKVNLLYVGTTEFPTAAGAAQYFVGEALLIQGDVGDLLLNCQ
jgi:hypothetical protein